MWIKEVELNGFGKFEHLTLEFAPGFNLILGENEAGKTTIVKAIFGILFGLPADKFRPWQGDGPYTGRLKLIDGDQTTCIERNFATNRVQLQQGEQTLLSGTVTPKGRSSTKDAYRERLEELLGFCQEELFRRSVLVNQMELAAWDFSSGQTTHKRDQEKEAVNLIKEAISGFENADCQQVLRLLEDDYYSLTKFHLAWTPGGDKTHDRQLETVQSRLAKLRERLEGAQQAAQQLTRLADKADRLRLELDGADKENGEKKVLLDEVRRFQALRETEMRLKADHSRLEEERAKREEILKRLEENNKRLAPLERYSQLGPEIVAELSNYRPQAAELTEKEREIEQIDDARKNLARPSVGGLVAAVAGIFLIVAGLFLFIPGGRWALSVLSGLVLLATVSRFLLLRGKAKRSEAAFTGRQSALKQDVGRIKARFSGLQQALSGAGLSSRFDQVEDMLADYRNYQQLKQEKAILCERLAERMTATRLDAELAEVKAELGALGTKIDRLKDSLPFLVEYSAEDIVRLSQQQKELANKVSALGKELKNAESSLMQARLYAETPQSLVEEIAVLEARQASLARKKGALALGITTLRECLEEYRSGFMVRFSQEIAQYMATVTGERYQEVSLDEEFSLKVKTPEGYWAELDQLSQGTQDQVYFAVRLALSQFLSGKKNLPFILDDPFHNFDVNRLSRAMELVKVISSTRQIIVCSHREEYSQWAGDALVNRL